MNSYFSEFNITGKCPVAGRIFHLNYFYIPSCTHIMTCVSLINQRRYFGFCKSVGKKSRPTPKSCGNRSQNYSFRVPCDLFSHCFGCREKRRSTSRQIDPKRSKRFKRAAINRSYIMCIKIF